MKGKWKSKCLVWLLTVCVTFVGSISSFEEYKQVKAQPVINAEGGSLESIGTNYIGEVAGSFKTVGVGIILNGINLSYALDNWKYSGSEWNLLSEELDNSSSKKYVDADIRGEYLWINKNVNPTTGRYSISGDALAKRISKNFIIQRTKYQNGVKVGVDYEKSWEKTDNTDALSLMYAIKNHANVYCGEKNYATISYIYAITEVKMIGSDAEIEADANGGVFVQQGRASYLAGKYVVDALPSVKREEEGYTCELLGWFSEKEGGDEIVKGSIVTAATVYYAHWKRTPRAYSIVYQGNGSTAGEMPEQTNCVFDEKVILARNLFQKRSKITLDLNADNASCETTKMFVDHTFLGWSEETGQPMKYANQEKVLNLSNDGKSKSLYAVWSNESVAVQTIPERNGYKFLGWAEHADASKPETSFQITGDKTLYAVWSSKDINYSVEYYVQNEFGKYDLAETKIKSAGLDTVVDLREEAENYKGYTLDKIKSTMTGKVKMDGSLVLPLYYQKKTLVLKFSCKDGGWDDASQREVKVFRGEQFSLPKDKPSRKGYLFVGWRLQGQAESAICLPGESLVIESENSILEAIWRPITYKLRYESNLPKREATVIGKMEENTIEYDKVHLLDACIFQIAGYKFCGWNTKVDGSGRLYQPLEGVRNLSEIQDGVVVLYAIWKAEEEVVRYNKNQPSNTILSVKDTVEDTKYIKQQENAITTKIYQLPGYYFVGWCQNADGSGIVYKAGDLIRGIFDNELKAEHQLYAIWLPKDNISFTIIPYYQNMMQNGYDMGQKQVLYGKADAVISDILVRAQINSVRKSYSAWYASGFTLENPEALQQRVKGDGSTEISLHFRRNIQKVKVSMDKAQVEKTVLTKKEAVYGAEYILPASLPKLGDVKSYQDIEGNSYLPGETITVQKDMVFIPKAAGSGERDVYQISYDTTNCKGAILKDSIKKKYYYGEEIILPKSNEVLLPVGYDFCGWYRAGDAEKKIITSLASWEAGDSNLCLVVSSNYDSSVSPATTVRPTAIPTEKPTVTKAPDDKTNQKTQVQIGETIQVRGITYQVKSGGVSVTRCSNANTKVVIPNTVKVDGKSYKVTMISNGAFSNCRKLLRIEIGENITTVGEKAFYHASKLKQVVVRGSQIKKVGALAWKGIAKKATIKVQKKKKTFYQNLFRRAGLDKNVKIG